MPAAPMAPRPCASSAKASPNAPRSTVCCARYAGFRMGPFELLDLTGLDVSHPVMESIYQQYYQEPRYRPHPLTRQLLAAGRLGRKSGQGFYRYVDGQPQDKPGPQPVPRPPSGPGVAGLRKRGRPPHARRTAASPRRRAGNRRTPFRRSALPAGRLGRGPEQRRAALRLSRRAQRRHRPAPATSSAGAA
ncbi:3-hydroxyacyl-CoA dehydrogenase family protein [Pseudomonas aeruginosa]